VEEIDSKRGATKRFVEYVVDRALGEKFSTVANDTGLHNTSVRDYFLEAVESWDKKRRDRELPEYVWLHRVKTVRSCTVIADLKTEKPIELVAREEDVGKYLKNRFNVRRVKAFAVELDDDYRAVALTAVPRAVIFVPRSELLAFSLEHIRPLFIWAGRNVSGTDQRTLKKLLAFGRKSLGLTALQRRMTQSIETTGGRAKTACGVYANFLRVLQATSASAARESFQDWIKSIPAECEPYLEDLVETLRSWEKEVFHEVSFEAVSAEQGRALALHIREIIQSGRGYDYEVLRAKLIYGPSPESPPRVS